MSHLPPAPGRTGSVRCPDRRSGICGAPWSRSSTQSLWCLFSMILCRQMVEQLPDVMRFFDFLLPVPEQVSEVPKILLDDVLCAIRSWRNSWWKCRRSYLIPGCSYEWSRTSTFQFLVVEGESLVFKVFFPDRVQPRCLPWNAFLSGLWSRTSNSLLVEAFKIFSQDRAHLHLLHPLAGVRGFADEPCVGFFFRTFPQIKKSATLGWHSGSALLPESSPPHQQLMWTPGSMATTSGFASTRAWAVLEEAAVGPRAVAPAVGNGH